MATFTNSAGDVIIASGAAARWIISHGFTEQDDQPNELPVQLKGRALDEALETAGLSKSGTADEKRARLHEHSNPVDDVDDHDPSQDETGTDNDAPEEQS